MPIPVAGRSAPGFSLPSSSGSKIALKDLKGKPLILYFYPKDNTSGCTQEACGFRDAYQQFETLGAVILGISPDSLTAHERFIKKFSLPFPLLADQDHAVAEKYGVWQEKTLYGRKYMGIARTTFVIDKAGKIVKVFEKVKPAGHEREVLVVLKELLAKGWQPPSEPGL